MMTAHMHTSMQCTMRGRDYLCTQLTCAATLALLCAECCVRFALLSRTLCAAAAAAAAAQHPLATHDACDGDTVRHLARPQQRVDARAQ